MGSGRSHGGEKDRGVVRETKADVPRGRNGKGNGASKPPLSSTAATHGTAGLQQAAPKMETGDMCYSCRKFGRPYNHRWLTCPYAQGTLRRGRRAPSQGAGGKQQQYGSHCQGGGPLARQVKLPHRWESATSSSWLHNRMRLIMKVLARSGSGEEREIRVLIDTGRR